jgi:L-alanine-DL-glutamate epimerase-like enolase superfamily enzyme
MTRDTFPRSRDDPAGWLADDIVTHPLVVRDGHGYLPQGIGIGMDLDETKLARYTVRI